VEIQSSVSWALLLTQEVVVAVAAAEVKLPPNAAATPATQIVDVPVQVTSNYH
jgi:hypothetical protein